ncbi:MAG TPA: RNA polymerase sigma factor [Gemmatimonadaceae bacterium]|jgi:RNA polymerase sigma-70 factor (ECF subfamily)|nr:RNA polymerase sigma factor [Gemmatimonadaceae bacterium]
MPPVRLNVRMIDAIDASATDETLVSAIRRHRSEAAFALLYDRHTPRGFQTAWRIVGGNPHEAEDVVQEAWLRAVASLDRWSGESDFGAWFRGIAAHVAIDVVRRQVRFVLDADADLVCEESPVEWMDMEAAILSLAPGYRAVLVLHDIEGFTHEEIGARLGITPGTSKGQLFKARRAVRARLAPRMERRLL